MDIKELIKSEQTVEELVSTISEAKFEDWEVVFKGLNIGGVKIKDGQKATVKARNSVEAVKKAASKIGVKKDYWTGVKTKSVNKVR